MATYADLTVRLAARFRNVPGVVDADIGAWLTEALYTYGYSPQTVTDVPDAETPLVLLLAQIQGARAIAFSVAHYFKYTDAEESVDKTMVAEQYRKLASDLVKQYEAEREITEGVRKKTSTFRVARRLDRDMPARNYGGWYRP